MLTVEEARRKIISTLESRYVLPVTATQTLNLNEALHAVLAESITAPMDVPPADNSAMDGYAINAADVESTPCTLPIGQRIAAGDRGDPLHPRTAARIFTGAEVPPGANAIVIQENCTAEEDTITLWEPVQVGDNIRRRSEDIARGETLLHQGHRLYPQDLGLVASLGLSTVVTRKPLQVALLNTGDELATPGQPLSPGQIYNSNGPLLSALLRSWGCHVTESAPVKDTLGATKRALKKAADKSDLVVVTGGVSVGEEDHVKAAIEQLGGLDLWKIALKPGKPFAFGHVGGTPLIGLPGNPVSAFVTAFLFAKPAIQTLAGETVCLPATIKAPARFSRQQSGSRQEYLRARIKGEGVTLYRNQSSGALSSISWANALVVIPPNTAVDEGDTVDVIPLSVVFYE